MLSSIHNHDDGDNKAVEGEGFSEDHHKNERNQNILLPIGANTSVANDTNGQTSSEGGQTAT